MDEEEPGVSIEIMNGRFKKKTKFGIRKLLLLEKIRKFCIVRQFADLMIIYRPVLVKLLAELPRFFIFFKVLQVQTMAANFKCLLYHFKMQI